jgi:hypothetical protein
MGVLDFILFPLYVYVFYKIFSWRRKRIKDPLLQKYYTQGFWIKVFSAFAFAIFSCYISFGDSLSLYYPEGANICNLIWKDPSNIKWIFVAGKDFDTSLQATLNFPSYFANESNYFVIRLVAIFSFIPFARYLVVTLMFSLFAYTGIWQLFKFFYEQYPHLHKKLAIAILYFPTFIFWSSGILKDSICVGMLGWMTYSIYNILYKRERILKNALIAAIAIYSLVIVKLYILISYVPFFLLFLFFKKIGLIKGTLKKIVLSLFVTASTIIILFILSPKLNDELGLFAVDKLSETVQTQQNNYINMADEAGSSFSLGVEFDGTPGSMLKMAPAAITATLFRPFLWESKKISTLLSSLESLVMMLFTLYVFFRVGPFNFITSLFKNAMVLFCFCFSIVFALFVGAITLNLGTLVRYKIPCLPFYIIALFLILDIYDKKKRKLALEKQVALLEAV